MEATNPEPASQRRGGTLAHVPTGAKVFLILLCALLPLALIALFTTIRSTRQAGAEAETRLRVAARDSSDLLADALGNQVRDLRRTLHALEADPRDAPSCTRLAGTFAGLGQDAARFAIVGPGGTLLCGNAIDVAGMAAPGVDRIATTLISGRGLLLRIGGRQGAVATVLYPAATIESLSRPSGFVPNYGAALVNHGERLQLRTLADDGSLAPRETTRHALDLGSLEFEMTMPGAQSTGPLIVATLVTFIMWIAAAAIGWFVVDRLLIRPLRLLRGAVGAYMPGEEIDTARLDRVPAQEIRELGDTFRDISRTVRLHEADLAEGLVRQTRLTREVHHRVKNNLQVIASLINFHARGATTPEATAAYASIQRRVDALAVVHRHHYAELEVNRGLELRSVISELATNIRATAPDRMHGPGIMLDIAPFMVTQDVAVAVAFLLTEIIELATSCNPEAQIHISVSAGESAARAELRVSSPALVECSEMEALLANRYDRVIAGLVRQLRARLHYEPLLGAYETSIAVTGES